MDFVNEFLPAFIPVIDDDAEPGPALLARRHQRLERIGNQHAAVERRFQRAPYQRQHALDAETLEARALEFDEGGYLRMANQKVTQFGQAGDVHVLETVAETLALGGAQPPQLLIMEIVDLAMLAAQALQVAVVEQHRHAVAGKLHVHLDEARTRGNGGLEPDQGVFRVMPGVAAVRYQLRDEHKRNFSTPA